MKYKWLTKTVGELTSYMAKGIPPKYTEEISDTTIYVLNQKCNRDYSISYEVSRLHDTALKKVPEEKILKVGDVLINSTGTGTAGRVAQMTEMPYCTTVDGHMIIMRPTDKIDSLYYGYALKSYQPEIESFAEGSTGQTEINRRRLAEEIDITYPDNMDLQKYIASILRALDDKISINTAINKNLHPRQQPCTASEKKVCQCLHLDRALSRKRHRAQPMTNVAPAGCGMRNARRKMKARDQVRRHRVRQTLI